MVILMDKFVLITGAFGFLGYHTALKFKREGYQVIGFGLGEITSRQKQTFYKCYFDYLDFTALLSIKEKLSVVVHCAGSSSVSMVEKNVRESFVSTVCCTNDLLEYVRLYQPEAKVVYFSSAAVYGDTGNKLIDETGELKPLSFYGEHKKIAEELCHYYRNRFALDINIIRPFSICGAGLKKQLLWDACNKFKNGITEFWGTGQEKRDWISPSDVAGLVYAITMQPKKEKYVFNACNGEAVKNCEFLKEAAHYYGINVPVIFNGNKNLFDPENLVGNKNNAEKQLDWQANWQWVDIVHKYVDWFKNN